jgi:CubicO group peptidase (beta-lactamase class C family)
MHDLIEKLFLRNFSERGELGASVAVWKDGEEILSLHQGWRDQNEQNPWTQDTLTPVWSTTKGPSAVAALLALHEGSIAFHSQVSELWPELKAARESKLTFAQLLSHQSGLPALSSDSRPHILSYRDVIGALEKQEPYWTPGKAHGYHPRTIGFLLEEIVRRVTGGISLGQFWNDRIATPYQIDFRLGNLTAGIVDRIATVYPPKSVKPGEEELPFFRSLADKDSLATAVFASPGGMRALSDINQLDYLQAGLPSLGGVGSANGLAKFYQILAQSGQLGGVQVLPKPVIDAAFTLQTSGGDHTFLMPTAFTAGFMRDPIGSDGQKHRQHFGPSHRAFGQPGAGGSHAFADPETGLSFAYVMNQMEAGILPNRKSLDLIDTIYEELE